MIQRKVGLICKYQFRTLNTRIAANPARIPSLVQAPEQIHRDALKNTISTKIAIGRKQAPVELVRPVVPAFQKTPEAWVQNVQAEYIDLIKLNPYFFSCAPRKDILHQMVLWQLAKRRQGTHKTKFRLERAYTKKKMYKQKGTGRARHSDKAAPQFIRTGGHAHPVRPRDFSFKLNATVRRLALRMAITTKFRQGKLRIVNTLPEECKTKQVQAQLDKLQANNALIIDGTNVNKVYERASSNLHTVDVLSAKGINVYDMLRRDTLVLTMGCLDYLNTHYAQYMTACK